jgi:hypothetical protein
MLPAPRTHPLGAASTAVERREPPNASPQKNSSFFLHQRSPLPHEALSPTRKTLPLRCAHYFSVSLPNRSFFATSPTTAWAILFPPRQLSGRAASWVAPDCIVSAHLKRTPSPQLNLQRAHVRRTHGRPRPNGFTGGAQNSSHPSASQPKRASGKALTFTGPRATSGITFWLPTTRPESC